MSTHARGGTRRVVLIALAAGLGALAVAGATLGYVLAGDNLQPQAAAPAMSASAKNAACAEVTRQYTWWKEESRALVGLPDLAPTAAIARAEELSRHSAALLQTLQAYGDPTVVAFAGAVTRYHVSIGVLKVDTELGGEVNTDAFNETLVKLKSVDDAYTAFLRASC